MTTNPADWDALGHQAEERGDRAEHFRCHLVAWVLRLQDERWHGEKEIVRPLAKKAQIEIGGQTLQGTNIQVVDVIPTFALLLDHPGTEPCERCEDGHIQCSACAGMGEAYEVKGVYLQRQRHNRSSKKPRFDQPRMRKCGRCSGSRQKQCDVCHGTGKATVRGHVGEFADWLRHVWGQVELAEKANGLRIRQSPYSGQWVVLDREPMAADHVFWPGRTHYAYPDACRELLSRLRQMLTVNCSCARGWSTAQAECSLCLGLKWIVIPYNETSRQPAKLP